MKLKVSPLKKNSLIQNQKNLKREEEENKVNIYSLRGVC